ncbi:MAG TPA: NADH-quinone oxidoreductase subunit J [Prolixibacteraceae bacterium]|nr:NADH-quinone oxidoreductase subunit J [Prolixibacteraceae bacterium]
MSFLFYLLSAIMIISGLLLVFSKSPINSVIALIVCFIAMGGQYILLNAQFLAVVHIIVYTGAIMVLFLFVIMLLNLNKTTIPQKTSLTRVSAVIAGGLFFLVMIAASRQALEITPRYPFDGHTGLVSAIGKSLFHEFLLPFEISSVLFISAMIGAVMFGKKDPPGYSDPVYRNNNTGTA